MVNDSVEIENLDFKQWKKDWECIIQNKMVKFVQSAHFITVKILCKLLIKTHYLVNWIWRIIKYLLRINEIEIIFPFHIIKCEHNRFYRKVEYEYVSSEIVKFRVRLEHRIYSAFSHADYMTCTKCSSWQIPVSY